MAFEKVVSLLKENYQWSTLDEVSEVLMEMHEMGVPGAYEIWDLITEAMSVYDD